jgi:hypothetical protein
VARKGSALVLSFHEGGDRSLRLQRPSWNPSSGRKKSDFKVGDRVRVVCAAQDFVFFRGDETGRIVRTTPIAHLPFIVEFDRPMRYADGFVRKEHNFDADDLEPLR